MNEINRISILPVGIVLYLLILVMGCGNSEEAQTATRIVSQETNDTASRTVTITIGNLTDATGVAANATQILTTALKDTIQYYNEKNKIPGVKLEVQTYDTQYDPAKTIPGYEWLKGEGSDIIWSPVAHAGIMLKPQLEEDKMVMILMSPSQDAFDPPGWVFAMGQARYDEQIYTLLNWISENDPDFPTDRPARIGGAMLNEATGKAVLGSAEEYAKNDPKWEWVAGFLPQFTFQWDSQADALKNCDYVIPAVPPQSFVVDYRQAGGKGKFIGPYALAAFTTEVDNLDLWDEMDGTYIISPFRWWTDTTEYGNLTRRILNENHPDQVQSIIRAGAGYITVQPVVMLLEAIRETVEDVGAQNFNSEELYRQLQSYSMDVDGCHHSFSETKRTSNNYMNIHQFDAAGKDLFLVHEGWIPIQTEH